MKTEHLDLITLYRRYVVWEAVSLLRHDVRNKLATVRNAAFYVRKRVEKEAAALLEKDKRVALFLEMIGKELEGADQLISDRIPSIGNDPEAALIDVAPAVDDALAALPIAPGVTVRRADKGVAVLADRGELAVALFCLLENALESVTAAGGCVAIGAIARGDRIAIEIADDGPGLAFEPTRALEQFVSSKPGRLGLGLPIARRIATRAHGTLELARAGERGARATLELRGAETVS